MVYNNIELNDEEYLKCRNFANESAKSQREYRSGGSQFRVLKTIEYDTLRGKVGEYVVKKFLEQEPFNIDEIELDFNIYPRGEWDNQDFVIGNRRISIKSVKSFSNWLLLETKDILREDLYDYYILVAVAKDYKSGVIKGFATKNDILNDSKTCKLKRGENIPGTGTPLDANNYGRHSKDLSNLLTDWENLISDCLD